VGLAPSLDSVGPLATGVSDAIALDALLRGESPRLGALVRRAPEDLGAAVAPPDPDAPAAADLGAALRLVVPEGDLVDDAEPAVEEAFSAALDALAAAGAAIERRPLRALEQAQSLFDEHGSLVAHEAWRVHRALLDSPDAERLDRRVLRRLRDGRALPPEGYDVLLRERPRLQALLASELDGAFALWPTVRHGAPELTPLERDDELFARVNVTTLANTMPGSFLDMPGIALPIGEASLLLSGPPGADARVLAAALRVAERVR
jgi:aspartyl-tRNA(Asn)/glutamyl-tRNA(Gln) amidotransferase subunit A